MEQKPSPAGSNGREKNGCFAQGNRFGRGNPHAKAAQKLRSALISAVSKEDLEAVTKALVEKAKAGDVMAARELFDRLFGRAPQALEITGEIDAPRILHTPIAGPK